MSSGLNTPTGSSVGFKAVGVEMQGMLCAFGGSGPTGFVGLKVHYGGDLLTARADIWQQLCQCLPQPRILHLAFVAVHPEEALAPTSGLLERYGMSPLGSGFPGVQFFSAAHPFRLERKLRDAFDMIAVSDQQAYRTERPEQSEQSDSGFGSESELESGPGPVADSATSLA